MIATTGMRAAIEPNWELKLSDLALPRNDCGPKVPQDRLDTGSPTPFGARLLSIDSIEGRSSDELAPAPSSPPRSPKEPAGPCQQCLRACSEAQCDRPYVSRALEPDARGDDVILVCGGSIAGGAPSPIWFSRSAISRSSTLRSCH